jgi:5-methylcytosine-specific restriction protein A
MLAPRVKLLAPQKFGAPATARTRGKRWMQIKRGVLREEPTCRRCLELESDASAVHASFEVDHIVPLFEGGTDERNNLQALCEQHHREKSEVERVRRGGGR